MSSANPRETGQRPQRNLHFRPVVAIDEFIFRYLEKKHFQSTHVPSCIIRLTEKREDRRMERQASKFWKGPRLQQGGDYGTIL